MKKIKELWFLLCVVLPLNLLAKGGNILSQLETNVNTQVTEAGSSIASMAQNFVVVIGVVWIIILLIIYKFQPEMFKNNMKTLFGVVLLLGVIYGLCETLI